MIRIEGLNRKQRALLDIMWTIDDMDRLTEFIMSLPRRDAVDCHSLIQMVMVDNLEEQGGLDAYKTHAQAAIDRAGLT
jgi:hypothetical protein